MLREVLVNLLWALHIISCVLLIIVVLLQSGRGSGVAGLFGGAAGESPFGAKTGTFLGKVTGTVAAIFFISAVILAMMSSGGALIGIAGEGDTPVNPGQEAGVGESPKTGAPPGAIEPKAVDPATEKARPKPDAAEPGAEAPKTKAGETTPKAQPPSEKPDAPKNPPKDNKEGT